MVFTRLPTSKSSRPFNSPLVTVPKAPITIGIITTFMFHSFFQFSGKVEVLISLFRLFQFYSVVCRDSKVDNFVNFLFFFFCWLLLGLVFWPRLGDPYVCQSSIGISVFRFLGQALVCTIYHVFAWSNLNFWHISQWITLPTQSCLVLYSFCANLLHSLIIWLMVSSLSPHSLHWLFCCVFSIFSLIWLVLMALFCAVIRRDSVSLLFLSHVQVLSCEMLFICRLLSFCYLCILSVGRNQSSLVFFYVVFESLYRCVNAVFDAGKSSPPLFFGTYSLSTSSQGRNALCMVIGFLLLWSICLSSSLVHFRKGP